MRVVLAVDDDPEIRELLKVIIGEQRMRAVAVADGLEALCWLRSGEPPPHLILLDLMMPRMGGLAFLAEKLRDPALAPIPVVVLSAGRGAEEQLHDLGCATLLAKPVDLATLIEVLDRFSG